MELLTPRAGADDALLRAAFREIHGARLHGFALLLLLGDRRRAAQLSAEVLAEGTRHVAELRHPERAAAWLRHRLVRRIAPSVGRRTEPTPDRLAALAALGVSRSAARALSTLTVAERAALILAEVERMGVLDREIVLGRSEAAIESLLARARARYLRAHVTGPATDEKRAGELRNRLSLMVDRTLARGA